ATGKLVHDFPRSEDEPSHSLAFAAGGTALLSGSPYRKVILWETATGKRLRTFRVPPQPVGADSDFLITFSPQGKVAVLVYRHFPDQQPAEVSFWEVARGKQRHPFTLSEGRVRRAAFSSDGKTLVLALDRLNETNPEQQAAPGRS